MPVSERTFLQLVLEDPEGHWELHCGRLRSKNETMTAEHDDLFGELGYLLRRQLDRGAYRVRWNAGHVRRSETEYYIPDVMVIPAEQERAQRGRPPRAETYVDPLPLVVEVWSPSTGNDDRDDKLPEYQRRGDREIWLLHPFEKRLLASVRQPDGTYTETTYIGGTIRPAYLPNVEIDLDALFSDLG